MHDGEFVELTAGCMKLRHKMMYLDERQQARGLVDDSSSTRVFFCVTTQEPLGPDGHPVSPEDCASGRACFCPGSARESS